MKQRHSAIFLLYCLVIQLAFPMVTCAFDLVAILNKINWETVIAVGVVTIALLSLGYTVLQRELTSQEKALIAKASAELAVKISESKEAIIEKTSKDLVAKISESKEAIIEKMSKEGNGTIERLKADLGAKIDSQIEEHRRTYNDKLREEFDQIRDETKKAYTLVNGRNIELKDIIDRDAKVIQDRMSELELTHGDLSKMLAEQVEWLSKIIKKLESKVNVLEAGRQTQEKNHESELEVHATMYAELFGYVANYGRALHDHQDIFVLLLEIKYYMQFNLDDKYNSSLGLLMKALDQKDKMIPIEVLDEIEALVNVLQVSTKHNVRNITFKLSTSILEVVDRRKRALDL
ncbi:MAG: hypothetical protein HQK59_07610 [Deltaproteobacteria bacterium]|nr:hypothetical protein [Deltaproteobacteria bacterium]